MWNILCSTQQTVSRLISTVTSGHHLLRRTSDAYVSELRVTSSGKDIIPESKTSELLQADWKPNLLAPSIELFCCCWSDNVRRNRWRRIYTVPQCTECVDKRNRRSHRMCNYDFIYRLIRALLEPYWSLHRALKEKVTTVLVESQDSLQIVRLSWDSLETLLSLYVY